MKQSYNPFKLFGSYIGLVIILLLPLYFLNIWGPGGGALIPFGLFKVLLLGGFSGFLIFLFGILIGFFLGYLTHLSFRKSILRVILVGIGLLVVALLVIYSLSLVFLF